MDYLAIFALIAKGVSVAQALIAAEQSAEPAIKAIGDLVSGAQAGTITDEQLAQTEVLLDSMIEDFNSDI